MALRLRRRDPGRPGDPSLPRKGDDGPERDGTIRLDRRTKELARRLKPGNIAIIDHNDVDRVAAESLLEHGVAAVVNAGSSITGRYPNIGPLLLLRAGIKILDEVGYEVFDRVAEGEHGHVDGNRLLVGDQVIAEGKPLDEATVIQRMDAAQAELSHTVERFAENTLDYIRREQHILLEGVHLPEVKTKFKGRHALIVTRGYHYKEDLRILQGFIREMRPVVVAVDGAADACLALGTVPDVIVGDIDSVTAKGLSCGAEILVHPQGDWRRRYHGEGEEEDPPELERVRALGLDAGIITAPGTSEDVAMLLAHEKGAELIVTVGSHTSLVEFLDKGRPGMASTFLVRLRVGPKLVDAKGVSQLYRTQVKTRDLWAILGAALLCMAIISVVMPPMRLFWLGVWDQVAQFIPGLR